MSPDRSTTRWLGGALLGVVALGMAAATLTSTVSNEQAGGSPGSGGDGVAPAPLPETGPIDVVEVPFLRELLLVVVAAILALAVVWALTNRKRAIQVAVLTAVAVAVLFLLFSGLDWNLSGSPAVPESPPGGSPEPPGSGDDPSNPTDVRLPPVVLVAVLGVALLVAAAAVFRSGGDGPGEESPEAGDEAAAVGRAAGRAAERIREGTDADNEVYRAWREMTGLLDVDRPESTSPGEFAAAAVDAGMTRGDVDELTRLFEEVRYGGAEPSSGLEERAVAAFERIETTYAEDG